MNEYLKTQKPAASIQTVKYVNVPYGMGVWDFGQMA